MRVLAVLLALLVPAGQVLAAMHLHCALGHPLGRVTPHAAGGAEHPSDDHRSAGGDPSAEHHLHAPHTADGRHGPADRHDGHYDAVVPVHDDLHGATLFDDHHHDSDASSHACCCLTGAAGTAPSVEVLGVDVPAERFFQWIPTDPYLSPFHEPPPRPQWPGRPPA
jgi:hypothetical protein